MRFIFGLVFFVIIGALMSAGCTQSQPGTSASMEQSQAAVPTGVGIAPPSAIESYAPPPVDIAVSAQINEKDQLDKSISVFFSGGRGQKMVRSSWVVIQRDDGSIERVDLTPEVQHEVILKGSDGEDLVRVYAEYFDGNVYQIAEKNVRMRLRV
jgi:hypothetical protein